jgi:hypothetical protein
MEYLASNISSDLKPTYYTFFRLEVENKKTRLKKVFEFILNEVVSIKF